MSKAARTDTDRASDDASPHAAAGRPADRSSHLGHALVQPVADRRIEILRRIADGRSISQAARDSGVSYKAAWQAIETLGNLAGQALVEKMVGGSGGGGTRLTAAGERLLRLATRLDAARHAILSGDDELAGLALRTSMRNLLRCQVAGVDEGQGLVRVALQTAGGIGLLSSVTRESTELLGLRPGLEVLALFKATAVQIRQARATATPPDLDHNHFTGRIVRGADTADGDVSLELADGSRLTGFPADGMAVDEGASALACLAVSAVVIALP